MVELALDYPSQQATVLRQVVELSVIVSVVEGSH